MKTMALAGVLYSLRRCSMMVTSKAFWVPLAVTAGLVLTLFPLLGPATAQQGQSAPMEANFADHAGGAVPDVTNHCPGATNFPTNSTKGFFTAWGYHVGTGCGDAITLPGGLMIDPMSMSTYRNHQTGLVERVQVFFQDAGGNKYSLTAPAYSVPAPPNSSGFVIHVDAVAAPVITQGKKDVVGTLNVDDVVLTPAP